MGAMDAALEEARFNRAALTAAAADAAATLQAKGALHSSEHVERSVFGHVRRERHGRAARRVAAHDAAAKQASAAAERARFEEDRRALQAAREGMLALAAAYYLSLSLCVCILV